CRATARRTRGLRATRARRRRAPAPRVRRAAPVRGARAMGRPGADSWRSAGRPPPAPCPSPALWVCRPLGLPHEPVALDLLIEVAARHVQRTRGFRHVPVVLLELRHQEYALGLLLELLERLGAQK